MWIFLDIILALIFILFAVDGYKKGFIKSVFGIGITIVSVIVAMNFYAPLADFFRSTVIYGELTDNLHEKIEEYIADALDEDSLGELLNDAPTGIAALLSGFGTGTDEVAEKYNELITAGETGIAEKISDYIVDPAAETLSAALAVLVVFIASVLVLNIVMRLLDLIFKLPILNFANKLGGFVIGAFTGLLVAFVFCTVMHFALPYLPGLGISIDAENAKTALLYSTIDNINPLAFLYQ